MKVEKLDYLSQDAINIRRDVFMVEQGYQENDEFDDIDDLSIHFVVYKDNKAAATCRVFYDVDKKSYIIGRVAVLKEYRGLGLGAKLIIEVEKQIRDVDGGTIMLSGQVRVQKFYEKLGFTTASESYLDEENVPHIWMKKNLSKSNK